MLGYLQYELMAAKCLMRLLWVSFDLVCKRMNDGDFPQSALLLFTFQGKDWSGSVVSLRLLRTYEEAHCWKRQRHGVK